MVVHQLGCEVDHSPAPNSMVMNELSYTFIPLKCQNGIHKDLYFFIFFMQLHIHTMMF